MNALKDEGETGRGFVNADPADADLIQRVAGGCEDSFLVLFRRWAPRLGRFLTNATGSPETAEDLLQETFIRVLRAAPDFEPRGSAGAWIYRIATNLVYSHWRRERARPTHDAAGEEAIERTRAPARVSPENTRLRRAFLQDASRAVRRLDGNKRMVFMMKVDQGMTYEEIAAVLRCPVGTTKSRFYHAIRMLQRDLSQRDWSGAAFSDGEIPDAE